MARFLRVVEQPFDKRNKIKRTNKMKKAFATLAGSVHGARAALASARIEMKEQISLKLMSTVIRRRFAYSQHRNRMILAACTFILSGYTMTIFAISNSLKL